MDLKYDRLSREKQKAETRKNFDKDLREHVNLTPDEMKKLEI